MTPGHEPLAQAAPASSGSLASAIEDVIVTASRRRVEITETPYNVSAFSGEALEATDTTSLAKLAQQVPGLDIEDRGARFAGATVTIIRGLNASTPDRPGLTLEQRPVATYIGNSPVSGYFPLEDVERIEVLRGPQGTLYGAGALGGAIRIIPKDPELNAWSTELGASGYSTAHSSDVGYTATGLLNAPLGQISALRVSVRYEDQPGFIHQFGIIARTGDPITSSPALANPADVANSSAVYYDKKDVNYTHVVSGRASLLVEPTDKVRITFSFDASRVSGVGGPVDNPDYRGGAWYPDPRITFPSTGNYQLVTPTLEPYSRDSELGTIDGSFDLGFATLSSTSTYYETNGATNVDATYAVLHYPLAFLPYYAGNPINPRFVAANRFTDVDRAFTQELRLVSAAGEKLDYVVGAFYEHERRDAGMSTFAPGTTEQTVASGGMYVNSGPQGLFYTQPVSQDFKERALFGELTWHFSKRWQGTLGGRVSSHDFSETLTFNSYAAYFSGNSSAGNSDNDHIVKLNTSYEFTDGHRLYATYSQGYRRGGANAFPLTGVFNEPAAIQTYKPDKANNYEFGVKGRFASGARYSADVFYVDWKETQIGLQTPINGWAVVVNAPEARSQGFEAEFNTPLFTPKLTATLGVAYADATLTKSFCLPAGNESGVPGSYLPCGIAGSSGDRLPGSPRTSGSATLSYSQPLAAQQHINYTLNVEYKGSIANALPATNGSTFGANAVILPSYTFLNATIAYVTDHWKVALYGTNLLDRRAVYSAPVIQTPILGNLVNDYTINQPRQIGLRLQYAWGSK